MGFRTPKTQRHIEIDTLRALACIALVSFHTVGNSPLSGLELPMDHWLHRLNASLVHVRMPLFSFLSGYVFVVALNGNVTHWASDRIMAKAKRLLLPLITVGTLFWLARDMMGSVQQPLWSIYVIPYAHFWYLQATFVMFSIFIALIWLSGGRAQYAAWILLCGGLTAWLVIPPVAIPFFALNGAIHLSGFFAAGFLAARYRAHMDATFGAGAQRWAGGIALLIVLLCGIILSHQIWVPDPTVQPFVALLIGMGGCFALLALRPVARPLATLGQYSYAIYLFHVFFTACASALIFAVFPNTPPGPVWPVVLLIGLTGPILVQRALLGAPVMRLLCLGVPMRRKIPRLSGRAVPS